MGLPIVLSTLSVGGAATGALVAQSLERASAGSRIDVRGGTIAEQRAAQSPERRSFLTVNARGLPMPTASGWRSN